MHRHSSPTGNLDRGVREPALRIGTEASCPSHARERAVHLPTRVFDDNSLQEQPCASGVPDTRHAPSRPSRRGPGSTRKEALWNGRRSRKKTRSTRSGAEAREERTWRNPGGVHCEADQRPRMRSRTICYTFAARDRRSLDGERDVSSRWWNTRERATLWPRVQGLLAQLRLTHRILAARVCAPPRRAPIRPRYRRVARHAH
jgi:hypothetical protein